MGNLYSSIKEKYNRYTWEFQGTAKWEYRVVVKFILGLNATIFGAHCFLRKYGRSLFFSILFPRSKEALDFFLESLILLEGNRFLL